MADGEVGFYVAGAGCRGVDIAAGDYGAGEPRLVPLEVVLVAGLAVGQGDSMCDPPCAPLANTRMPCGTRICISAVKRSVM